MNIISQCVGYGVVSCGVIYCGVCDCVCVCLCPLRFQENAGRNPS